MATGFTTQQWGKINALNPDDFGLPVRRNNTFVMGTFNMLELGSAADSDKRWDFLTMICERFDFLAIQEVTDSLDGLNRLVKSLPPTYRVIVSDTTGQFPGDLGNAGERLAYLYRTDRVRLDEIASDISYDRSRVLRTLYDDRDKWIKFFEQQAEREKKAKADGTKAKQITEFATPAFLTFIRQPHFAAFTVLNQNGDEHVSFLVVNAHLLYGKSKLERKREFEALLDWLIFHARKPERMYHGNLILFGDLNLEFELASVQRDEIDKRLKELNEDILTSDDAARVNFPLLFEKPGFSDILRTNARQNQTYDHIAFFVNPDDTALPRQTHNDEAGLNGPDGYDYGVFDFVNLFTAALFDKPNSELTAAEQTTIFNKCKADVSDHMPAWVRIAIP